MADQTRTPPVVPIKLSASLDGFPIEVEVMATLDQLPALVERLRGIGAVPPASPAAVAAETERSAPVCKYHGPMKPSAKVNGGWYCPAKMGDGSYCKEKA